MAEYAIAKGHRILGVDQAGALLEIARTSFPGERWIEGSMESYAFDQPYAAAILWDSLFHIPRAVHEPILRKTVAGLPPGGRVMLTAGGSASEPFTDVMFGERFFYDSHAPEETEAILLRCGCRIVLGEFMNLPTGGRDKGRSAFVAERLE